MVEQKVNRTLDNREDVADNRDTTCPGFRGVRAAKPATAARLNRLTQPGRALQSE